MTQRSMFGGPAPTVIIKAGANVIVEGWDSEQVVAESHTRGGLKLETRSAAEIARARAVIGDRVLFDLHLKQPGEKDRDQAGEVIEVQIGSDGRVRIPRGSQIKVYAGKDAQVSDVHGPVSLYAGGNLTLRRVHVLAHASSGGAIDLECETLAGNEVKLEAGRDLRCYVRSLASARLIVSDLGGYWEGVIGSGISTLRLKAGGDVTLVTDQKVDPLPPDYLLGQIERPAPPTGQLPTGT